ncbi:DUF885 domain-containing protein [Allosphingosinicella deserti]|uniref:DUF885 domain-containing protein n=1 Tax=Allosphingosinicella deserti TaxID=2116704 RepID=A0A2P7QN93_9SPHN|nr:DUF885 family protein [Sphingomonas deserti]PSJ39437.1 DUF885 domain-containing protein [Sphingomonas deserti]
MKTFLLVHALTLTSAAVSAQVPAAAERAAKSSADARFETIYTDEYAWRERLNGPSEDGPRSIPDRFPDVGPKVQAEKLARWTAVAAQLASIDPGALSPENRVNFAVYSAQIEALLAGQRYREYEKPLNADSSFWGDIAGVGGESFRTETDYRNYIQMLRTMPGHFAQQIVNMRAGLARGFTPPKVTLEGRESGVVEVAGAKTPEASPYYAPFKAMPDAIPRPRQAELRTAGKAAIAEAVIPAHRDLLTFLRGDYFPKARTALAAYDLPDGKAYYQAKIREFVTLDLPAEEIHRIGLREVAKIRARMHDVMRNVKFEGDLKAFLTFLRTDPRFYAKTPQELLDRAAWIAKTFDGKAGDWFGRLPRSRFAIKPVPEAIAPFYTSGRGGPGIYLVNTYNLSARALYSLPALTLHESAPGHAFQMPLANENDSLPKFRRESYLSAYGEGWALYSEALGEEMGMYETPYDLFGMLSYQMWRAARLVVDTGIHTKGWTRAQAIAFLLDNTALAEHEVTTEVDRYIAWPGQALSYYMGELAIQEQRARAQHALGDKFDIRAFHDAVLSLGSVPLPVIKDRIDQLIADGGKGPYPIER